MSERIKKIWSEDRIKLIVSFVSTFAIGLAAHAYGFLNNIFSHDSLNALYADSTENLAKISVGRFLVPVFRALRGPVALPWLIGLISLALLSLSVYIVIKLFKVESRLSMVLISGIMVTNVTVIAIVGTYIHEFDFDMLSLLLSLIAVYCWRNAKKITSLIPAAIAMGASIALYQSYVEVTVTVIIMLLIFDTLKGEKIKDVFLNGVKGAGFVAVGSGIYYALNTVIIRLFETAQLERVDAFAGYMDVQENHDAFFNLSQIVGMPFKDSTGVRVFSPFFNPYKALFRYCFNYPMNVSDENYLNDKRLENMPCYPVKGYIRNIDGVLVVNLGSMETLKTEDCNLLLELKEIAGRLK